MQEKKPLTAFDREQIAKAEDKRFRKQERNLKSYYHHGKNNKRILFKGKDFAD